MIMSSYYIPGTRKRLEKNNLWLGRGILELSHYMLSNIRCKEIARHHDITAHKHIFFLLKNKIPTARKDKLVHFDW